MGVIQGQVSSPSEVNHMHNLKFFFVSCTYLIFVLKFILFLNLAVVIFILHFPMMNSQVQFGVNDFENYELQNQTDSYFSAHYMKPNNFDHINSTIAPNLFPAQKESLPRKSSFDPIFSPSNSNSVYHTDVHRSSNTDFYPEINNNIHDLRPRLNSSPGYEGQFQSRSHHQVPLEDSQGYYHVQMNSHQQGEHQQRMMNPQSMRAVHPNHHQIHPEHYQRSIDQQRYSEQQRQRMIYEQQRMHHHHLQQEQQQQHQQQYFYDHPYQQPYHHPQPNIHPTHQYRHPQPSYTPSYSSNIDHSYAPVQHNVRHYRSGSMEQHPSFQQQPTQHELLRHGAMHPSSNPLQHPNYMNQPSIPHLPFHPHSGDPSADSIPFQQALNRSDHSFHGAHHHPSHSNGSSSISRVLRPSKNRFYDTDAMNKSIEPSAAAAPAAHPDDASNRSNSSKTLGASSEDSPLSTLSLNAASVSSISSNRSHEINPMDLGQMLAQRFSDKLANIPSTSDVVEELQRKFQSVLQTKSGSNKLEMHEINSLSNHPTPNHPTLQQIPTIQQIPTKSPETIPSQPTFPPRNIVFRYAKGPVEIIQQQEMAQPGSRKPFGLSAHEMKSSLSSSSANAMPEDSNAHYSASRISFSKTKNMNPPDPHEVTLQKVSSKPSIATSTFGESVALLREGSGNTKSSTNHTSP
jgi:hypothetical protein